MVGLQGVFSLTGSFFGFPITMNVLPRMNLVFNFDFLMVSSMFNVDLDYRYRIKAVCEKVKS